MKQVMECVARTGGTVIVVEGERALAVMDFYQYRNAVIAHQDIVGLTEEELLDKINRTIAIWKQEHADIDMLQEYDTLQKPGAMPGGAYEQVYVAPSDDRVQ